MQICQKDTHIVMKSVLHYVKSMCDHGIKSQNFIEKVASNKAILTYVQSKEHPTDLMTKGLDSLWHQYLCAKLGFINDSKVRGSVGISDTLDAKASPKLGYCLG